MTELYISLGPVEDETPQEQAATAIIVPLIEKMYDMEEAGGMPLSAYSAETLMRMGFDFGWAAAWSPTMPDNPDPTVRRVDLDPRALEDLEGKTRELLVAIQGDPYFHGVWAWREGLATDSISYQHTPEAVRVVQAFARLEALLGLREPERSPDPTARAVGLHAAYEAEWGRLLADGMFGDLPRLKEYVLLYWEHDHLQGERIALLEARVSMFEALITICAERNEVIPSGVVRVGNPPLTEAERGHIRALMAEHGWTTGEEGGHGN